MNQSLHNTIEDLEHENGAEFEEKEEEANEEAVLGLGHRFVLNVLQKRLWTMKPHCGMW